MTMGDTILFIIILLLHLLACGLIYLGIRSGVLNVHRYMFLVAVCLPLWGPVCLLALSAQTTLKRYGIKTIDMDKFQLDSDVYRSFVPDASNPSDTTVSMEEALIVNSPKERRALIMDVLNDNPKEYVDFLKKAGNNEDTEVVHYAVTAMVEMSKENDYMLWQLEKLYAQNQQDLTILTQYCDLLWNCLEQGLMQGQVEKMNRNLFDEVIRKRIHMAQPSLQDYTRCIENSLALQNYTEANIMLEEARKLWPRNEALFVLKIQYAASVSKPEIIKQLLASAEADDMYLSAKTKEVIAFWKD